MFKFIKRVINRYNELKELEDEISDRLAEIEDLRERLSVPNHLSDEEKKEIRDRIQELIDRSLESYKQRY